MKLFASVIAALFALSSPVFADNHDTAHADKKDTTAAPADAKAADHSADHKDDKHTKKEKKAKGKKGGKAATKGKAKAKAEDKAAQGDAHHDDKAHGEEATAN